MGKTTVERVLRSRGYYVVDTDEVAREVVAAGQPALAEVVAKFGSQVLNPDGTLHRARLAETVFSDGVARKQLEAILHPRIRDSWRASFAQASEAGKEFGFVVIPLLFETGAERELRQIICVACSKVTQTRRLSARAWSTEQRDNRIAAQMPVEQKLAKSDYVVWNEAGVDVIEEQLDRILSTLRRERQ